DDEIVRIVCDGGGQSTGIAQAKATHKPQTDMAGGPMTFDTRNQGNIPLCIPLPATVPAMHLLGLKARHDLLTHDPDDRTTVVAESQLKSRRVQVWQMDGISVR